LENGLHDLETARKQYSAMRDLIIHHRGGSRNEHLKWAQAQISGADFLRLQILRELDDFHARLLLLQLEAIRNEAARLAANLRPGRRLSG
jgi:hypothetical protein